MEDILHPPRTEQAVGRGEAKANTVVVDWDREDVVEEGEDYVNGQTRESWEWHSQTIR